MLLKTGNDIEMGTIVLLSPSTWMWLHLSGRVLDKGNREVLMMDVGKWECD